MAKRSQWCKAVNSDDVGNQEHARKSVAKKWKNLIQAWCETERDATGYGATGLLLRRAWEGEDDEDEGEIALSSTTDRDRSHRDMQRDANSVHGETVRSDASFWQHLADSD